MNNTYIKSVPVNLFSGIFNVNVNFSNGLNIISGVNGTGKTQLLMQLKNNTGVVSVNEKQSSDLSIFAISPKRNMEKQAIDSILQQVKTQNKTQESFIKTIQNFKIKDTGFETYPSFAELFIQEYELLMQDGITAYEEAVKRTMDDFNNVLKQVFSDYEFEAKWIPSNNGSSGSFDLKIKKYGLSPITIDQLSTGEREVFSLLFCIFISRKKEDIYLIDEPEIHLNWDLEKGLFSFFDWFCGTFEKQIIVVTHSRVIFMPKFFNKTQFLVWENNKIICKKDISEKQKLSIAGEVSSVVNAIELNKPTFFVEDEKHNIFVNNLAKVLNKNVNVVVCGNKSTVKTVFNMLKEPNSNKAYFLTDGDNETININNDHFISLKRYCIENYLFDIYILSKVFDTTEDDVKEKIIECIKELSHQNVLVYKKLAECSIDFPFEILDTLDIAKYKIIDKLVKKFDKNIDTDDVVVSYINIAHTEDRIKTIFEEIASKLSLLD